MKWNTDYSKIKEARESRGLSQEALAARLGVTKQRVSDIESGKYGCSLRTIERIANAMECPPAYFFVQNVDTCEQD